MAKKETEKAENKLTKGKEDLPFKVDAPEFPASAGLVTQTVALVEAVNEIKGQYKCAARSITNLLFSARDLLQGSITDPITAECTDGVLLEDNLSAALSALNEELCSLVEELNIGSRQMYSTALDIKESVYNGDDAD